MTFFWISFLNFYILDITGLFEDLPRVGSRVWFLQFYQVSTWYVNMKSCFGIFLSTIPVITIIFTSDFSLTCLALIISGILRHNLISMETVNIPTLALLDRIIRNKELCLAISIGLLPLSQNVDYKELLN